MLATGKMCARYCKIVWQSSPSTRFLHNNVLEHLGIWSIFSIQKCTRFFTNGAEREPFAQATNTLKFTVRSWELVFSEPVRPERPVKSASQYPPYKSTWSYTEKIYGNLTPCPLVSRNGFGSSPSRRFSKL